MTKSSSNIIHTDNEDSKVHFGRRVGALRAAKGITQKALAESVDVAHGTISNIIHGRYRPRDRKVAEQLSAVLEDGGELTRLYDQLFMGKKSATSDELERSHAALRSYLQRAEVRLSTVNRVAGSFLAGAGILLLVPILLRDAVPNLMWGISLSWTHHPASSALLATGATLLIIVPIWGFLLLIEDLLGFYFTGHRFGAGNPDHKRVRRGQRLGFRHRDTDGIDSDHPVFNPRFTLTGLRMPERELPAEHLYQTIAEARLKEHLRVLIPNDNAWRRAFDDRIHATFDDPAHVPIEKGEAGDEQRLTYAFRFSASIPRTLTSETAKMELMLAKHTLLIRILVLRYFKTMMAVFTTGIFLLMASALVTLFQRAQWPQPQLLECLLAVFLIASSAIAASVSAPLRWIYRQSPGNGKLKDTYRDKRMVRFENSAILLCLLSAGAVGAGIGTLIFTSGGDLTELWVITAIGVMLWILIFTRGWKGRLRDTPEALSTLIRYGAGRH